MLVSTTIATQSIPAGQPTHLHVDVEVPETDAEQPNHRERRHAAAVTRHTIRRAYNTRHELTVRAAFTDHATVQHAIPRCNMRDTNAAIHRDLANNADRLCGQPRQRRQLSVYGPVPQRGPVRALSGHNRPAETETAYVSHGGGEGGTDAVTIHTRVLYSSGTGGFMPAWHTPPREDRHSLTHSRTHSLTHSRGVGVTHSLARSGSKPPVQRL